MIDVELLDRWFEAGYESGTLVGFNLFDRRFIVPLSQMASMLADRLGARTTDDDIRQFEHDGWLRLEPCGENGGDVGATLCAVERIVFLKALQREGWGNAELADYAEFEDEMVTTFQYEGDPLRYLDDDLELLIHYYTTYIEAVSGGETRDAQGNLVDRSDDISQARKQLEFLEKRKTTGVTPELKKTIARHAFRVRANDEAIRVMIVEGWRSQLRAGFTINVAFDSTGSRQDESGEVVFVHGKLNWHRTVRSAYGASEGKAGDPTIRVPGFVLSGDQIMTSKTVRPHDYERMWRDTGIDAYLAAWSEIRGVPTCMNCFEPLPRPNNKNAQYCTPKCRAAAKARRYRERNPDSAARAQVKYRVSIAEDE
jgi:hypothetical protein